MAVNISVISFIIGGALVAIGIFGKWFEIKEPKISKLNKLSRILAVIGGVATLLLAIYLGGEQNKKPHPHNEPANEKTPAPIQAANKITQPPGIPRYEKSSPPNELPNEKTPAPIQAANKITRPPGIPRYEKSSPPNELPNEKTPAPAQAVNKFTQPPGIPRYEKSSLPNEPPNENTQAPIQTANKMTQPPGVPPYEESSPPNEPSDKKTSLPIKRVNKKTPPPIVSSYKSDLCNHSEYSVPNDEVKNVSDGTTYNIRIMLEFNSEKEAAQGRSEFYYSLRLNGESLYPQGEPGIVLDRNGWQVYQEYQAHTFQKGIEYSLIGITYKKPRNYIDTRKVKIKCE